MKIPFTKYEIRALKRPRPEAWDDFWFERQPFESATGMDVTEDSALRYSAVWACCKVISEDLASLPLLVYRKSGKSKERAPREPVYSLLHDAPNDEMSAMQFREAMQLQVLLWGNSYAEIQRDLRGRPLALWPMNPGRMKLIRDESNALRYEYRLEGGEKRLFFKDDILHIPGLSFNGLVGLSPISYHREAIGVGLAAQEFQGSNYKSGAFPSIALSHPAPKAPSPEGRAKFRKELAQEYAGSKNAGKILTLWEGMKAETLSMSMKDAEFIESRKYSRTEIAAIFRVPPHKIMDLERATFSNIEQQSISYVVDAIRPWAVRWEQAINQRLLDNSETVFCEHLLDGLLRGDLASRYGAYAIGRQWGWLSINDIRQLENMNPVENGDDYLQPMNMVPVGQEPPAPDAEPTEEEIARAASALQRLKLIRG